jgi:hypothetical protein
VNNIFNKLKSKRSVRNQNPVNETIEQIRQETRDIIYHECKLYLKELAKGWKNRKEQAEASAKDLINLTSQLNTKTSKPKNKIKVTD